MPIMNGSKLAPYQEVHMSKRIALRLVGAAVSVLLILAATIIAPIIAVARQ